MLYCSASFLSTMRIAVILGRDLSQAIERAPEQVAVVNQRFVDQFLAGRNPLGQEFYLGSGKAPAPSEKPLRIVGVVKERTLYRCAR